MSEAATPPSADVLDQIEKLVSAIAVRELESRMKDAQLKADTEAVTSEIFPGDLVMTFDVTLHTPDGRALRTKGSCTMDQILSEAMLREAKRNFDNSFYHLILRPVQSKFNGLVNAAAIENGVSLSDDPGIITPTAKLDFRRNA